MRVLHVVTISSIAALSAALGANPAVPTPSPAPASSPPDAYAHCAACHGQSLEGGTFGSALRSSGFVAKWNGKLGELRTKIETTMPLSDPGGLSDAQYDAVTAYIAKVNGGLGSSPQGSAPAQSAPPQTAGDLRVHPGSSAQEGIGALGLGPQAAPEGTFHDAYFASAQAEKKAKLVRLGEVTAATLRNPPPEDWLTWRRTQDASGYSPLAQINRRNAGGLAVKWSWSLPAGSNSMTPLIRDGVMFVQSGREVQALDARNGELLWRFRREVPAQFRGPVNSVQRSMAIFGDKLFVATADRHLVALDFRSGAQVWDFEIASDDTPGLLTSSGPFMAGNVLMHGVSMGPSCSQGCYVVGVDPQTGKRLWTFNTVAKPGEPGGDTWNGTPLADRSGGAVWIAGSYDPDLDLVYFGTGGTYGVSHLLTPRKDGKIGNNDALYTNSTIALNPRNGKLVWAHQHFPRELWDLDEVFERTLIDLPVNGKVRKLAVSIGKVGILDALDRESGKYVFSKDFGLTDMITAINPRTGARTVNPAKDLKPNVPVDICPSPEGARNWMATAYSAETRVLFVPMQDTCATISWVQTAEPTPARGRLDIGWHLKPPANSDGKYGRLEAVDLTTRKTLWTRRDRNIPSSSLLATAGGLLFSGNADRWFRALDQDTGNPLWEIRLNAVPNATPVTYSVDGKQYVAITTGGGGPHDADTVEMTPESERAAYSTTVWVFALGED